MINICDCTNVRSGAHFHYDLVELKDVEIALSDVRYTECSNSSSSLQEVASQHVEMDIEVKLRTGARCNLKRTFADLRLLDYHLHECAFGRPFSKLADLRELPSEITNTASLRLALHNYVRSLSVLISNRITCCTLFEFLELESHGLRKQSKVEQSNTEEDLNVPALCAARCVRAHVATDSDELPLNVGDLVAVVDMPEASESIWWKGKSVTPGGCFKVGYFPLYCIELFPTRGSLGPSVLLDATNQQTVPQPPPPPPQPVGASNTRKRTDSAGTGVSAKKSILLKRGKLGALLRAFFATRPTRTALKQRGLLRDRVFSCDLSEYLLRIERATPPILDLCSAVIESVGVLEGIYRLSGPQSVVQRLRARMDDDQYLITKLAERSTEGDAQQPSQADTSELHTNELLSVSLPTDMEVSATSILRPLDEHQRATRTSSDVESGLDSNLASNDSQLQSDPTSDTREIAIDVSTGDTQTSALAPADTSSFRAPWFEDAYSLAAVLRMYFRELPNPLFTFELYDELISLLGPINALYTTEDTPQIGVSDVVTRARQTLAKLPRTHYRTARALFMHLQRMARLESLTSMGARNLAIVWSPNLLWSRSLAVRPYTPGSSAKPVKSKVPDSILSAHQALSEARDATAITEFFIRYAHRLFDDDTSTSLATPSVNPLTCSAEGNAAVPAPVSAPAAVEAGTFDVATTPNTSFAATTGRPRRLTLLELADAIRVQYPDGASRDRLLAERLDALLVKYGKDVTDSPDSTNADGTTPDAGTSRVHISLPSHMQHHFDKELAAVERDLQERGRRVADIVSARRRTGTHTSSFWKSLFAVSGGSRVHRRDTDASQEKDKENYKLRKLDSSRLSNAPLTDARLRALSTRSYTTLGPPTVSSPAGAAPEHRSSRLWHSDRRGRTDKHAQATPTPVTSVPKRVSRMSSRSQGDVRPPSVHAPAPVSSEQSQWYEPAEYVNLPLARPASLVLDSLPGTLRTPRTAQPTPAASKCADLVEFDREPSIRRSAAIPIVRRSPMAGFAIDGSANWVSSPTMPEYSAVSFPRCDIETSATNSCASLNEQSEPDSATLLGSNSTRLSSDNLAPRSTKAEHLYENVEAICQSVPTTLQRKTIPVAPETPDSTSRTASNNELIAPAFACVALAQPIVQLEPVSAAPLELLGPTRTVCAPTEQPAIDCTSQANPSRIETHHQSTPNVKTELVSTGLDVCDSADKKHYDANSGSSLLMQVSAKLDVPLRDADDPPAYFESTRMSLLDREKPRSNPQPSANREPAPPSDGVRKANDTSKSKVAATAPQPPVEIVNARLIRLRPARVKQGVAASRASEIVAASRNSRVGELSTMFDVRTEPSTIGRPASTALTKSLQNVRDVQPADSSLSGRKDASPTHRRASVHNDTDTASERDDDFKGASAFAVTGINTNNGKPVQAEADRDAQSDPNGLIDIRLRIATFESLASPPMPGRARDNSFRARDTAV